jgi:hypothetical protein
MKNINEEITNLKYLMNYNRSLTLNENTDSLSNVPDEILKKIDEYQTSLCKTNPNTCVACGDMMRQLPTGTLKEKQIELCLECDKKTGEEYNNCSKMKGMIMNASIQYNKELGDVNNLEKGRDKVNIVSTMLATLTTIYSQLNQLFKQESTQ